MNDLVTSLYVRPTGWQVDISVAEIGDETTRFIKLWGRIGEHSSIDVVKNGENLPKTLDVELQVHTLSHLTGDADIRNRGQIVFKEGVTTPEIDIPNFLSGGFYLEPDLFDDLLARVRTFASDNCQVEISLSVRGEGAVPGRQTFSTRWNVDTHSRLDIETVKIGYFYSQQGERDA